MKKRIILFLIIILTIFFFSMQLCTFLIADNPVISISSLKENDNVIGPILVIYGTIEVTFQYSVKVKAYIGEDTSINQVVYDIYYPGLFDDEGIFSIALDISRLNVGENYTLVAVGYNDYIMSDPCIIKFKYYSNDSGVYIAGSYTKDITEGMDWYSYQYACYWQNGVKYVLEDETNTLEANSIFVSGEDVYVAGFFNNGSEDVACYWKNGNRVDLSDGTYYSKAMSIFVSEEDVYVAGLSENGACYWKNGTRVDLGCYPSYWHDKISIFVSGEDVYIASNYYNGSKSVGFYYKNGTKYDIENATFDTYINSIYVSGTDVYLAGYYHNGSQYVACYWKNGSRVDLTDGTHSSIANSIFVSGEYIYIAGSYHNGSYHIACYWKNKEMIELENVSDYPTYWIYYSNATSIYVSGEDLYIAGYFHNDDISVDVACYWKNGIRVCLVSKEYISYSSRANSIFVINQ